MEILGVGASEFVFIIVIAIIVLGPKDMQKAGKTIGRWLNQLRQSDGWKVFQQTSREIRNIPNTLMREANMEMLEAEKELRQALDPRGIPSAPQPGRSRPPSNETENSIQSPRSTPQAENPEGGDGPVSTPDNND